MIGFKAALGATHAKADMVETPRRVGDAWEMIIVKDGERLRVRIAREDDAFEDPILEVGEPDRPDDLVADRPVAASPMEPTEEPAAPDGAMADTDAMAVTGRARGPDSAGGPPATPGRVSARPAAAPTTMAPKPDLTMTFRMARAMANLKDEAKTLLTQLEAAELEVGDEELVREAAKLAARGDLTPLQNLVRARRGSTRNAAAPPP